MFVYVLVLVRLNVDFKFLFCACAAAVEIFCFVSVLYFLSFLSLLSFGKLLRLQKKKGHRLRNCDQKLPQEDVSCTQIEKLFQIDYVGTNNFNPNSKTLLALLLKGNHQQVIAISI